MSRAGICLIKHMGKSSPIEAYRADMADDVAERVAGGEEVDAAWLAVIDDKLADLGTEAARIEQVVADAYAARPSKTAEQVDATHKDPGQPAEPVTQEVVAQAISKAAKSEERPRAAMRDELLAMIDAKMVDAKDEYLPTWKAPTREQIRQAMVGTGITNEARIVQMLEGQHQNRVAEASDRIGFVTFDVPGDGKFKVLNTRSKLEDFRKRVEQSPGFKDQRYREPGMTDASSGGKLAAFTGMVDEGDMQAALDYAAATGLDPKTAKLSDMLRKRLDKWMRDQEMAAAVAAREEPTAAPAAEAATVKESLTTETAAEPEEGAPAAANRLTEAQARKAFEWRDLGTKEGTRTYALFFADPADGRSMRYGEVTLFKGSTRFAVDGGEGAATLKAAKAEAEQLALVRLAQDGYAETPADPAPNDRDSFTLERVTANNTLEKVTFKRGEYITFRIGEGGKQSFGEIDGISHAKRQFSVDGLWYDFGFAYKAERPAETPKRGTVPMSKVVDAINKKHGAGLGPADAVSPIEAFKATMNAVYDGTASVEDYKAAYKRVRDAAAVKAELGKLTKDELIRTFGIMARPDEKKDSLVATAYKTMLRGFALGKEYGPRSYMMTRGGLENYEKQQAEALDAIVENHTADDLAAYAAEVKASREERAEPAKINDAGEKTRTDDTGNVALFSVFTPTFTVDANPDAAQTPADGQVSPDDRRAVELLQAGLRKQRPELVLNAVSSGSGAPGSQLSGRDDRARQAAADVAARLFGKRLTFFTSNVPLAAGAYSTKQPDRIFLARDNAHPIMAVTGHEILHAMRKDRPDLYDALLAAIRKNSADVDQAGLLLRLKYKKLNLTTPTPEVQEEEFLADVVGDRWTEPEFWALMSQGQPQGMRRVLAAIVSWLDALVDKIPNTRPFNTAVYLTDIKAARKAVAEAMRNYSAGEVGTVPDDGEVRFSLADPTDTPAFRRWFGDSKVVDAQGKPLVVYHGTKAEFTEFKRTKSGEFGPAIYLTDSAREAGEYGDGKGWGGPSGTAVMPVYVSIKNPYTNGVDAFWKEFGGADSDAAALDRAQAAGYDGIIAKREDRYYDNAAREFVDRGETLTHYIAFRPEQIKSAIGNSGAFDPKNADIRYSRAAGAGITMNDAEAVAATVRAMFPSAPPIIVHDNVSEVRPEVQDMIRAAGAFDDVEAMFHEGEIHVFASHLKDIDRALFVVGRHEIRHAGMAAMFGSKPAKRQALLGIALKNRDLMDEAMARVSSGRETDRIVAIEEVLADMPVSRLMALDGIDRLIARIRQWLRDAAAALRKKGYASLANAVDPSEWTDNDVAAFVLRAENMSRGSGGMRPASGGTMFSRAQQEKQERTAEKATAAEKSALAKALTGLKGVRGARLPAGYVLNDFMGKSAGTMSAWHKTVGTPYNVALRQPQFKPVFDAIQDFLNDVSHYAAESANKAPTILPKLETLGDVLPEIHVFGKTIGKSAVNPVDAKATAAPVFEGTLDWGRDEDGKPTRIQELEQRAEAMSAEDKAELMLSRRTLDPRVLKMWRGLPLDQFEAVINGRYRNEHLKPGVVWSDAELRSQFNLTPQQIALYREFRAATDQALEDLALSSMLRVAGKEGEDLRAQALSMGMNDAAELLRDRMFDLAEQIPDEADKYNKAGNAIIDIADRVQDLQDRGYAPLSRFGGLTLDVVGPDGERLYFGMFETDRERKRKARELEAQYPDAIQTQGTVSKREWELFAGVTPETLELFADKLGISEDLQKTDLYQNWLRFAKADRSGLKRLIHRKGVPGFSQDIGRVLASFVYSTARQTSMNLHAGTAEDAIEAIDRTQGQLKDYAVALNQYVKNPQEEAQALRGILFAQYLGGSVASAMVNMTQPFMVTFPYLSQFGGAIKAEKQMAKAIKDVGKRVFADDPGLTAALRRAAEGGVVSPQEVFHLQAQASGKGQLGTGDGSALGTIGTKMGNTMSRIELAWGKPFEWAEQFNRRVTFIASYRTAVEQGMPDPEAFATRAVEETQFVYNKGNRPQWARGTAGALLFTFKTFSISMMEVLTRSLKTPQGRRTALVMLVMIMLVAGVDGLPFMEDMEDVIDGFAQRVLERNWSTKAERNRLIAQALMGAMGDKWGMRAADLVAKGISGLPGAPVDVSGRLGLHNLIPGTGVFLKKDNYSRDVAELAGPAGSMTVRAFEAAGQALGGNIGKAALTISPVAIQNVGKAVEMARTGYYPDTKGNMVVKTGPGDAVSKAIGFQPNVVKRTQDIAYEQQRLVGLAKLTEREIVDAIAKGIVKNDEAAQEAGWARVAQWNIRNPETPIKITPEQPIRRARNMTTEKTQRMLKSAPRELRPGMADAFRKNREADEVTP